MKMPANDSIPRQAVIVADSFNSRFKPITLEKPRCLLPLANKPLIDYTLQHLINNGFWDLIVLTRAHGAMIEKHITESRYSDQNEEVTLRVVKLCGDSCSSMGDAMRELSSEGHIRGPFVLVTGDLIANMDMRAAMEAHQANKTQDKEAIMTCIFKKVMPGHPTRGIEDDVVVCLNPHTNQLLRFQNANTKKFEYELELLNSHPVMDFRYDLMNTYVILCEAHIPSRFGDHFDIQDMDSFIKGIIGDEETCSETIYIHILEQSYAARVSNLRTYAAVTHDMLHRWTYPIVPDNNTTPEEQYIYRKRGIYLPNSVRPYKAKIHQNTLVGSETIIGRDTDITDSVIGRKCEIGANVKIRNSYIWDEVTIHDDCVIDSAVLCSGAIVKQSTEVTPGCILSYDTVIGPTLRLKPGTRVTVAGPSHIRNDSECSTDSADTRCSDPDNVSDTDVLGADHWGVVYRSDSEEEGEEGDCNRLWYVRHPKQAYLDDISDSSDSTPVPSDLDDECGFYGEVCDSFRAGFNIQKNIDTVLIEINASKHAYNVSVADQIMHSTRALLEICIDIKEFCNYVQYFGPMFIKLARDRASQIVILDEIETWALEKSRVSDTQKILHTFYNLDVLDESNILDWAASADDDIQNSISKFLNWLKEAEEESSEEEESD